MCWCVWQCMISIVRNVQSNRSCSRRQLYLQSVQMNYERYTLPHARTEPALWQTIPRRSELAHYVNLSYLLLYTAPHSKCIQEVVYNIRYRMCEISQNYKSYTVGCDWFQITRYANLNIPYFLANDDVCSKSILVKTELSGHYSRFLFSWSLDENQSEERYATGWGVWGGPTVFMSFSATFTWVTRYRAELTSVAKCILQLSEVV
jgi:hypothetical protein